MPLSPKTLEIWAGVRRPATAESALSEEMKDLLAKLSGFNAYKDFLRSQSSFDDLRSNLKSRSDDYSEVDNSDVDTTVDLLVDNFADFGTYKGDDSSGALSQSLYDDYRGFLISNGISSVDADEHIQLLKTLFPPGGELSSDSGEHLDWDELKKKLEDLGVLSDDAETTIEKLKTVFESVKGFDRFIFSSDSWTEVEDKLVEKGLTRSEAEDIIVDLKTAYGDTLDKDARGEFSEFDSFAEFEDYLIDKGFAKDEASKIINKIKEEYTSYDTFRKEVLSKSKTVEEILSVVKHDTKSSDTTAGIKVHETAGRTEDDVAVSAGSVEVIGTEIHFSSLGSFGVGEPTSGDMVWKNLTVSDLNPYPRDPITIDADVENTTSSDVTVVARLLVDSAPVATKSLAIPASSTRSIRFRYSFDTTGSYDIAINTTSTKTVFVNETSGL